MAWWRLLGKPRSSKFQEFFHPENRKIEIENNSSSLVQLYIANVCCCINNEVSFRKCHIDVDVWLLYLVFNWKWRLHFSVYLFTECSHTFDLYFVFFCFWKIICRTGWCPDKNPLYFKWSLDKYKTENLSKRLIKTIARK